MRYHCRPDGTSVVMGIVDDEQVVGTMPAVKEHIFLQEKSPWWPLSEGERWARHDAFNEPFQRRLQAWASTGAPKRPDV